MIIIDIQNHNNLFCVLDFLQRKYKIIRTTHKHKLERLLIDSWFGTVSAVTVVGHVMSSINNKINLIFKEIYIFIKLLPS